MGVSNTQYPIGEFEDAVNKLLQERLFVTTPMVAEEVGCSRETARLKLNEIEKDTDIESELVSSRLKVWFKSDIRQNSETVLFFPSRREIVVESPTEYTSSTLSQVAHLIDSTADGYMYKITEQDVWNAPYDSFDEFSSDIRQLVDEWDGGFESRIKDDWKRAHKFRLETHDEGYTILSTSDEQAFENTAKRKLEHNKHYTQFLSDTEMRIKSGSEANVKQKLYEEGYPPIDERRLDEGTQLDIRLIEDINLRDYQKNWIEEFAKRRSGVFVGPSGSGKTVAAIGVMEKIRGETLIIVPNRELAQQWEKELLEKTNLPEHKIGQYHGGEKRIRPVTVATYDTAAMTRHREIFDEREWGLIIADECHHSVAECWKRFESIQSKARLGLSATPIRESQDSKEIYTLIGPPIGSDWGKLFTEGWVEKPEVTMITVPWESESLRERFQRASGSRKMIEAARNPSKVDAVKKLIQKHSGEKKLIFVDWIGLGKDLSDELNIPFIYGESPHSRRDEVYEKFREGDIKSLIVSRIGDEGVDLPDAEVAILASTMGASRSQTGQRAGRIMRPFGNAKVYLVLTKGSSEEDWGRKSTQYLAEKGININKSEMEIP